MQHGIKTQVQVPSRTGAELSPASALPVTLWWHLRVTLPHPCQALADCRVGKLEGEDCTAEEFNYFGVMRTKKWPTVRDMNLIWDETEACYTLHNVSFKNNLCKQLVHVDSGMRGVIFFLILLVASVTFPVTGFLRSLQDSLIIMLLCSAALKKTC